MREYTYSEARQQLAEVLENARRDGEIRIRRRDGQVFVLRPVVRQGSPLNVPGLDLDLSDREIVDLVKAGRRPV